MRTLPDTIDEENRKLIMDLFNWLVQPCLGMGRVCVLPSLCVCGGMGSVDAVLHIVVLGSIRYFNSACNVLIIIIIC